MARIAAFDLDDTLVDTWTYFSAFLRENGLYPETMDQGSYVILAPEAISRFHAEESLAGDRAAASARDTCAMLRDAGWELHVVTARSPVHRARTMDLVGNAFGDLFEDVHCVGPEQPKWRTLKGLGAEFFADDHPGHVGAAAQAGVPSVLFGDLPWNRTDVVLPRTPDWQAMLEQGPWQGLSHAFSP